MLPKGRSFIKNAIVTTVMVKDISIVIPAYNEEGGIKDVLREVVKKVDELSLNSEIIVVDDGSTDSTAHILDSIAKTNDDIIVLAHKGNRGYGAALKTGIVNASNDTIVVVDADCTYPLDHLGELLEEMESADMVVGARTGHNVHIETIRKPAKWFLGKLAGYLAEREIPDLNSGLRVFSRDIAISYFHILPNKFSFTTTITLAMFADDYTVSYVPIDYYGRKGDSKIRFTDAWNFLILIFKTIFYFNPLRIIMPVSFFVGLLGLGKLSYDLFVINDIGDSTVFLILLVIQLLGFGLLADLIVRRT